MRAITFKKPHILLWRKIEIEMSNRNPITTYSSRITPVMSRTLYRLFSEVIILRINIYVSEGPSSSPRCEMPGDDLLLRLEPIGPIVPVIAAALLPKFVGALGDLFFVARVLVHNENRHCRGRIFRFVFHTQRFCCIQISVLAARQSANYLVSSKVLASLSCCLGMGFDKP